VVAAHRSGTGHASFTTLLEYDVLDKVVGAKIRSSLGMDKVRVLSSGAAPISPDLLRWFHGIGLPVGEVYGQTEDCGPATINPPDAIRIGTVGIPIPGLEVRIADDGEILVRGGSVCAGYWRNPQATAELIEPDGWMHTGDVGTLDDDGYLTITDRKKDLIITAAGQNVAPQQIETRLREEPLIAQPVVVGDGRKYLTALITLDSTELSAWAHRHHKLFDPEQLARDPEIRDEVARSIERVNAEFARVEGIKRFRVLPHEFTVAAGELTPTLKVRRRAVVEQHAAVIEEMYADQIDLTDGSTGIGEVRTREGTGS
jgi:long-chain acyl-CoA synthetase